MAEATQRMTQTQSDCPSSYEMKNLPPSPRKTWEKRGVRHAVVIHQHESREYSVGDAFYSAKSSERAQLLGKHEERSGITAVSKSKRKSFREI